MSKKVALIGYGYLGQAYHKMFPDAVVYDEPKNMFLHPDGTEGLNDQASRADNIKTARDIVNSCNIAIIAVPTDPLQDGGLDTSIVEHVVDWLETPLILIKSALMPGTVDHLVGKTGKKIAVSVEMIGMGNYYIDPSKYPDPKDPQKHQTIIVGGELDTASQCAEILWSRMSPTVRIHLLTAREAEITKLIENAYPAMKVTFQNCLMNLAQKSESNYIRIHQAWSSDSRVDSFHQRAISYKRAWQSHCWDKDLPALVSYANEIGATDMAVLFQCVIDLNKEHLSLNESS